MRRVTTVLSRCPLTPLCDSGTSTEDLSDIVLALLCDNGTSTEGLVNLVSASSQTEESMFQEADKGASFSSSSNNSFNEDPIEQSASNANRGDIANCELIVKDNVMAYNALLERCEKAEAKLAVMEVRHGEDIANIKRDQDMIRADLRKLSNPVNAPTMPTPNPVID